MVTENAVNGREKKTDMTRHIEQKEWISWTREQREAHKALMRSEAVEESNPNCRCGRPWYPRYWEPLSERFSRRCSSCHRTTDQCACGHE